MVFGVLYLILILLVVGRLMKIHILCGGIIVIGVIVATVPLRYHTGVLP